MPGDDFYTGSVNGTAYQDLAAGFEVGSENVLLGTVRIPLASFYGVNQADVSVVGEKTLESGAFSPDESVVLEHWFLDNIPGPTEIYNLESTAHPKLLAGHRYWVVVTAHVREPVSYIGWWTASTNFTGDAWIGFHGWAQPDWTTALVNGWLGGARPLKVTALH